MFGINDPYVLLAFLLCIASTILCAVYGLINWNKGDESPAQEDVTWAQEEKKEEEEI